MPRTIVLSKIQLTKQIYTRRFGHIVTNTHLTYTNACEIRPQINIVIVLLIVCARVRWRRRCLEEEILINRQHPCARAFVSRQQKTDSSFLRLRAKVAKKKICYLRYGIFVIGLIEKFFFFFQHVKNVYCVLSLVRHVTRSCFAFSTRNFGSGKRSLICVYTLIPADNLNSNAIIVLHGQPCDAKTVSDKELRVFFLRAQVSLLNRTSNKLTFTRHPIFISTPKYFQKKKKHFQRQLYIDSFESHAFPIKGYLLLKCEFPPPHHISYRFLIAIKICTAQP